MGVAHRDSAPFQWLCRGNRGRPMRPAHGTQSEADYGRHFVLTYSGAAFRGDRADIGRWHGLYARAPQTTKSPRINRRQAGFMNVRGRMKVYGKMAGDVDTAARAR